MPRNSIPPPPGPGRPKGSPNKATTRAREAIADFVEGNSVRINGWLEEVYQVKGAEAALNIFRDFVEFHVPKLGRTELTGKDGDKLELHWPLAPTKLDD